MDIVITDREISLGFESRLLRIRFIQKFGRGNRKLSNSVQTEIFQRILPEIISFSRNIDAFGGQIIVEKVTVLPGGCHTPAGGAAPAPRQGVPATGRKICGAAPVSGWHGFRPSRGFRLTRDGTAGRSSVLRGGGGAFWPLIRLHSQSENGDHVVG